MLALREVSAVIALFVVLVCEQALAAGERGFSATDNPVAVTVVRKKVSTSPIGNCSTTKTSFTMRIQSVKSKTTSFSRVLMNMNTIETYASKLGNGTAKHIGICAEMADQGGFAGFSFIDGLCKMFGPAHQPCRCDAGTGDLIYVRDSFWYKQGIKKMTRFPTQVSLATSLFSLHFLTSGRATPIPMSTDVIEDSGGFLAITGKGLHPNQTYQQLPLLGQCQCRAACNADPPCQAYSFRKVGPERFLCSLAKENVYVNTPTSMGESTYAVRKNLVKPYRFDNLIYQRLNNSVSGFDATKQACSAFPGYRMVSVRFEAQMAILLELCLGRAPTAGQTSCTSSSNWFFVDMVKVNGAPWIRGVLPISETDLTSVLSNDSNDIYIYAHSGKLHDEARTRTHRPVCQANVFGVTW